MGQTFLLSVPMAFLWMIFARQVSIEGFIVGYIFGFGVMTVVRLNTSFENKDEPISLIKIPGQLVALVIYIIRLSIDVFLSGIDVGKRVINPALPINPGIQRIYTQDERNNELVSALSAHSITITPGELVVDFETDADGKTVLIVHALDTEASDIAKLDRDQVNRLKLIKRILGHE